MTENEGLYGVIEKRNIEKVVFGGYIFDTWYGNTAYFVKNEPQELGFEFVNKNLRPRNNLKQVLEYKDRYWISKLHVCCYCFKYTVEESLMEEHLSCCPYKFRSPGRVMYKDDSNKLYIRKVRGKRHKLFCQNMCLFGKLFLDNKSVFFNLDNYDFYVIYGRNKDEELIPMGFFSKELLSWDGNNLACILVFPPFQKQRLGQILISFSYELSRWESKISGPELPLSPFGKVSYISFWSKYLAREFLTGEFSCVEYSTITLETISRKTGFRVDDVVMLLDNMNCLVQFGVKNLYEDFEDETVHNEGNFDVVILKELIRQWSKNRDISRSIKLENLVLY